MSELKQFLSELRNLCDRYIGDESISTPENSGGDAYSELSLDELKDLIRERGILKRITSKYDESDLIGLLEKFDAENNDEPEEEEDEPADEVDEEVEEEEPEEEEEDDGVLTWDSLEVGSRVMLEDEEEGIIYGTIGSMPKKDKTNVQVIFDSWPDDPEMVSVEELSFSDEEEAEEDNEDVELGFEVGDEVTFRKGLRTKEGVITKISGDTASVKVKGEKSPIKVDVEKLSHQIDE